MTLAGPVGVAAGYALTFSGYGFLPAWLFLTLSCPALLCLITSSRHMLIAVLFALAMMAVLAARAVKLVTFPEAYGPTPPGVFVLLGIFAAASVVLAACIGAIFSARRT